MQRNILREFIESTLDEEESVQRDDDKLLLEPDFPEDDEDKNPSKKEMSVCGNVAGVTTPLGTSSSGKLSPAFKKRKK